MRKEEGGSLDTLVFSSVPLRPQKMWSIFWYARNALYYQGKKLFVVEPPLSPIFLVLEEKKQGCTVDYLLCDGKERWRAEKIFFADVPIYLQKGKIGLIRSDLPKKYWKELEVGETFVRHFYEEELPYEKKEQVIKPVLQMQDCYGTRFSLLFQEEGSGKIFSLEKEQPDRAQAERDLHDLGWEKEQGFFRTSLENMSFSLPLFVSSGWKVLTLRGSPICFLEKLDVQVHDWKLTVTADMEGFLVDGDTLLQAGKAFCPFVEVENFGKKQTGMLDLSLLKRMKSFSSLQRAPLSNSSEFLLDYAAIGALEEEVDLTYANSFIKELFHPPVMPSLTGFQGKLYPYQEAGVAWMHRLAEKQLGGLLADEMGLGKTVQVLAFLSLLPGKKCLIIAPAHLVYHWEKEALRFLEKAPYVHVGKERKTSLSEENLIITSYTTFVRDLALFKKELFHVVIMDESSAVKNIRSQSAQGILQLRKLSSFALNGTPIDNRYEELWSQFSCIDKKILGERRSFIQRAFAQQDGLFKQLFPFLCKRTKKEVSLELPPMIVQDVLLSLGEEHKAFYEEKKRQSLRDKTALEVILRLRQAAIHPALLGSEVFSEKFSRLFDELEELRGTKALIFSSFTTLLDLLEKELLGKNFPILRLDGSVSLREREKRISQFQTSSKGEVFLLSMKAASVGLNLPAADTVFILDPWWNESLELQAMARAHRVGRKKPLLVRRYIAKDTIEEKILTLKQDKLLYNSLIDASVKKEDCLRLFAASSPSALP